MSESLAIFIPASFATGYLFGAVPFGLVLVYLATGQDIRTIGSGNIGATNVLRTGHKGLALLTLLLDALKGAIAYAICSLWLSPESAAYAGFGAVIGHCFPIWLKFKGGKGVATGMAVIAALSPLTGLVMALSWLLTAVITRLSSLSALLSFLAAGLFVSFGPLDMSLPVQITVWGIGGLSWVRHKENIQRIIKGNESRISFKKNTSD